MRSPRKPVNEQQADAESADAVIAVGPRLAWKFNEEQYEKGVGSYWYGIYTPLDRDTIECSIHHVYDGFAKLRQYEAAYHFHRTQPVLRPDTCPCIFLRREVGISLRPPRGSSLTRLDKAHCS